MGWLVNGWNNVSDNNTGKTFGGQFMVKPNAQWVLLTNYLGGPEENNDNSHWRQVSDTVITFNPVKEVSLALNYDYGWEDKNAVCAPAVKTDSSCVWQGIAGYVKLQPNDWFALSPRFEYYNDHDGFTTGTVQKLQEATFTLEFKHKDGVMMRLEYRYDHSNTPFYLKTDDSGKTTGTASQQTFAVGVIYAFSSKMP
jgi:hypothetical protein